MRLEIRVTGIVQGVGFRPFVYRIAVKHKLAGYVLNKGDAGVEIVVDGHEKDIKDFTRELEEKKPPLAQIHDILELPSKASIPEGGFTILKSSKKTEQSGSIVPPDVAICDNCLAELRDREDPRKDYFFITCTDCGPRYTTIHRLPYDRVSTTVQEFQMCEFCQSEYSDSLNRRFHAQTLACPKCGPRAYLTTSKGERVRTDDPIREAGKLLSEGCIVAVKGYGGFHLSCTTMSDEPLVRLRRTKYRRQKPFAIMARNIETAKEIAKMSPKETEALSSHVRPIVLLHKRRDCSLSHLIAPGLHNIGVMLPYTGLHYMLFDKVEEPALLMTSANPPNQPIIKDNEEALATLGDTVDYFLFHNRQIAQRCDDSVIRLHQSNRVFLRRSRGYAPAPVILKKRSRCSAVGLGGELNNTGTVLLGNKAFTSQHIGDVENIETRLFLERTIDHLIRLTNAKIEAIGCDLHPKFNTTRLAHDLAERSGWDLVQVQHHYAHIAALMVEHDVDEIIGVCCDGYGYGPEGEAWGGEVLYCDHDFPQFKRLAHLEKQSLVGGDLATRYPLRVAAGILHKAFDVGDWLLGKKEVFPHGRKEVEIILQRLSGAKNVIETTSCGRVLDAAAAVLDLCTERTYEGEPAMKLESAAIRGRDVLNLDPIIKRNVLDTTQLLLRVFEDKDNESKADLAYSVHSYVAKGLATLAIQSAMENDVSIVGFSGGVACNEILTSIMRQAVQSSDLRFLVHEACPPGDGGLSFGQAIVAGFMKA